MPCKRAYAELVASCDAMFDRSSCSWTHTFFFFVIFFSLLLFFFRATWSTREQRTLESTLPVLSYIRPSMLLVRTLNVSSTSTIQHASLWVTQFLMMDERWLSPFPSWPLFSLFLIGILCCQVSALKCGFLPVSQESVLIGEVSYHDYYGILVDPEERESIARNLGPLNKVCQGVVCAVTSRSRFSSKYGIAILVGDVPPQSWPSYPRRDHWRGVFSRMQYRPGLRIANPNDACRSRQFDLNFRRCQTPVTGTLE